MTVEQLRKSGYRVFVTHRRYYPNIPSPLTKDEAIIYHTQPEPKGGVTTIEIYHHDDLLASGYANCSFKDNFVRRLGVNIALGRALKNLRV